MSFGRLSAAAARLFPRRAALVRRCSSGGGPLALDGLLIPKAFVESEMPAIVDLFSAFAVPGQSERELDAGGRAAHSPCAPAPVAARPHASRPRQPLRAAANSMPTPPPRRLQKVLAAVGEHPSPETLHRMFVEADTDRRWYLVRVSVVGVRVSPTLPLTSPTWQRHHRPRRVSRCVGPHPRAVTGAHDPGGGTAGSTFPIGSAPARLLWLLSVRPRGSRQLGASSCLTAARGSRLQSRPFRRVWPSRWEGPAAARVCCANG